MAKRRRSTIAKMIDDRKNKIEALRSEIIELRREDMLLCDKNQHFTEQEEEVLMSKRPKKYKKKLVGRIHWRAKYLDEATGKHFTLERTRVVRVDGEWL